MFSSGNAANMPSAQIKEEDLTDGNIDLISLLVNSGLANTRSEQDVPLSREVCL